MKLYDDFFLHQTLLANSSHCMENNIPISEKTISVTCQFSLTELPNASLPTLKRRFLKRNKS